MSAETAIVSKEKTKAEESTDHDPKATVPEKTTPTEIVTLPLTEQETLERFNRTQHLKHRLLDPKTDMILIAGKPYIKKSGWRKLQFAFNLTDEIIHEEKEEKENKKTIWRMWVRVRAPNGREVIGVASASSDEKKFNHPDHDPYALCHTRAKNRAISDILGLGEVSAEEMLSDVPEVSAEVEKAELTQVPTVQPVNDTKLGQQVTTPNRDIPVEGATPSAGKGQTAPVMSQPETPTSNSQPEPNSLAAFTDERLASELEKQQWRLNSNGNGWNLRWDSLSPQLVRAKLATKFSELKNSKYVKVGGYSYKRYQSEWDQTEWLSRYAVNPPGPTRPAKIIAQTGTPVSSNSSKKTLRVPLANDFLPEDNKPTGLTQLPLVRGLEDYGMLNQLDDEIAIVPKIRVNPDTGYFHWFLEGSAEKSGIVKPICDKYNLHYELSLDENKLVKAIVITGGQLDYQHVKQLADGAARTFQILLEDAKAK
ncbi:MAG: hypothetical protein ABSD49_10865 [Candidatus Bathyarchaeia archaeon]